MPASNEEFIKKAFESGLTEEQVRGAVAERNQRNTEIKTKEVSTPVEKRSIIDVAKGASQEYKTMKDMGMSGRQMAGEVARGMTQAQRANVGTERSTLQKGVEGTAGALGFGAQVGLETIGKAMGGKKGSALMAGASSGAQSLIRENYQNLVGRQDQSLTESAATPFVDAGAAAAIDVAFNAAIDDVLTPIAKKVSNPVSNLLGKVKGKAEDTALGSTVKRMSKTSYDLLQSHFGDVKEAFKSEGLDKIKWWEPVQDKFDKHIPLGVSVGREKVGVLNTDLSEKILKPNPEGKMLDRKVIHEMVPNIQRQLNKEGYKGADLKSVNKDIANIINKELPKITSPDEALKIGRELKQGTFTTRGKVKANYDANAQNKVGTFIYSWIKDEFPEAKENLAKQRTIYLLNDAMMGMQTNVNKNIGEDLFAGLSPNEIKFLSTQLVMSGGALAYGGANDVGPLKVLGAAGFAAASPQLAMAAAGGPEKALFKLAGEKATKEGGKNILSTLSGITKGTISTGLIKGAEENRRN